MNYPTISIVTACFNHEKYISQTIESIIFQKYPNLQYVVIDDGSTDNSWQVIKKYEKYLYCCERLKGKRPTPGEALNYAFSKTNGEIMGWLNSDDMLLPMSLFTVTKIFQDNTDIDWITGIATAINENSELINQRHFYKNIYDYILEDWAVIQQESTFFSRNLWVKTGSRIIENKWAFDTELWTRFVRYAKLYHANTPLGAYRKIAQSQSIRDSKTFMEHNNQHLNKFKQKINSSLKFEAQIYKFLKSFSFILSSIPGYQFESIPILKKFAYDLLVYSSNENKWQKRKLNPFKKYNPY